MAIIFANLLAGLGLFFIGVKLIGSHLGQMAGRKFREWVAWVVRKPWHAGILGFLAGALTQSTIAVTFIVTSMNTAGLCAAPPASWRCYRWGSNAWRLSLPSSYWFWS